MPETETPIVETNIPKEYMARVGDFGNNQRAPECYERCEDGRLREKQPGKLAGPVDGGLPGSSTSSGANDGSASVIAEALSTLNDASEMIVDRLEALCEMVEIITHHLLSDNDNELENENEVTE